MPASILIADDYDDNRELLRLMLEAMGYRIREARNGHECVLMAQTDPPDLILIDLSMPVLDGWGVLKKLRATVTSRVEYKDGDT
jgi:CheY-like chemotaxis protein